MYVNDFQSKTTVKTATHMTLDWQTFDNLTSCSHHWKSFSSKAFHSPFQNYHWLQSWLNTYGQDKSDSVHIVVGSLDDVPIIILPLYVSHKWGLRTLTWLAQEWNDYNIPVCEPENLAFFAGKTAKKLWEEVHSHIGDIDVLELGKQPESIAGVVNPFIDQSTAQLETDCSHEMLLTGDSWDEIYTKKRSTKSRRRLREKERALTRDGELVFKHHKEPEEIEKIVPLMLKWKHAQLSHRGARNPFDDIRSFEFLTQVAKTADKNGQQAQIYILYQNDKPLSALYMLSHGNTLMLYQASYDVGPHERYSPGLLLLHQAIDYAISQGFQSFDFGMGDEKYKADYVDNNYDLFRVIMPTSLKGNLLTPALAKKAHLAKWIKSNPATYKLALKLNKMLGDNRTA